MRHWHPLAGLPAWANHHLPCTRQIRLAAGKLPGHLGRGRGKRRVQSNPESGAIGGPRSKRQRAPGSELGRSRGTGSL